MAISAVQPQWLEEIQSSYNFDPEATKLLSQLAVHPKGVSHYSLANGIIRYKGKIWLGHNKDLQGKVFHALHNSALGVILVPLSHIIELNIFLSGHQ
jgi:hypothetical protein